VIIDLRGTNVTAAKAAERAKLLPGCKIEWDGGVTDSVMK